jgi:hypothetical protein
LGRSTPISTAIPARSLRVLLAETRRIRTFETSVFMDAAIASRKPSLTVSENSATVIGRPRVIFMTGELTLASLPSSGDGVVEGMVLEDVAVCVVRGIVGSGVDAGVVLEVLVGSVVALDVVGTVVDLDVVEAVVVLNALVGSVVSVEVTGAVVALNVVGACVVLEVAVCSIVS